MEDLLFKLGMTFLLVGGIGCCIRASVSGHNKKHDWYSLYPIFISVLCFIYPMILKIWN